MAKIKMSTSKHTKSFEHSLPTTHITTLDFGQPRPVNILPLLAGENVSGNYKQFTRLAPLVAPTLGSFQIKTSAFFVPYTSIWSNYEEWRKDSKDSSLSSTFPYFYQYQIVEFLIKSSNTSQYLVFDSLESYCLINNNSTAQTSRSDVYNFLGQVYNSAYSSFISDFEVSTGFHIDSNNITDCLEEVSNYDLVFLYFGTNNAPNSNSAWYFFVGLNLNLVGRNLLNTFESLGYSIPRWYFNPFVSYSVDNFSSKVVWDRNSTFSFLPLVSFIRCLYDYVYPSHFIDSLGMGNMFSKCGYGSVTNQVELVFNHLVELLNVPYRTDFWTSLFQHFNSYGPSLVGGSSLETLPTGGLGTVQRGQNDTANVLSGGITSYALRWLQDASDYVLRNDLAGTRFGEWLRAHFGFKTIEQDFKHSRFIRSWSDVVNIQDVTATTGTSSQLLGETAGKGFSFDDRHSFTYKAEQDGFLIFIAFLVPSIGYVHGIAPWTKVPVSNKDYYTPEFDSVGMEGVPYSEIHNRLGLRRFDGLGVYQTGISGTTRLGRNDVFGYCPRYSDMYKRSCDYLTGDFALNSRNANLGAYHTFRDVSPLVHNNLDFKMIDTDFNRIFAAVPSDGDSSYYDKFLTLFQFDIKKRSFVTSMTESLPLFNKSGQDVTIELGGNSIS